MSGDGDVKDFMTAEFVKSQVKNGVKGDPDCQHGENFNISSIKQSLVSVHTISLISTVQHLTKCKNVQNAFNRPTTSQLLLHQTFYCFYFSLNSPVFQLSPAYLHTNSTSHVWAFSAVAELIGEILKIVRFI